MSNPIVTIFPSIHQVQEPTYISLETALNRIRQGKHTTRIDRIRGGEKSEKTKLPIVLFSGEFSGRKDDNLKRHSGLIVLDFDHIDVERGKNVIGSDRYVRSCWVSPSGNGIKALVEVQEPSRHRDHFRSLQKYFDSQYGLEVDSTGINESRACFESCDPEIVVKDADVFSGMIGEQTNATYIQNIEDKTDYEKLNIAARMIAKASDGEKHSTLIRAAHLIGGYVGAGKIEEDVAYYVLEREIEKHDLDDMELARRTIKDGVAHGKTMPIKEVLADEEQIKRDILLQDGDMSFVSSDDADFAWIDQYREGNIEVGLSTGNTRLDENFRFKKEFVMINGHSNIGKTTFTLFLMVSASMNHGWRWVIYSAENTTAALKMKLMQFCLDKHITSMSYQEQKRAYQWVKEHFVVIKNDEVLSYTDVLLFAEKLHRMKAIDGLFIDPYNSLRIDGMKGKHLNSHEYHYEAASDFLTFSNRLGVAVWVNAHSVTESQRQKDPDGYPRAPFAEDTEGGGKWVNRADCFITLHRKVQHTDPNVRFCTEMHVRKVRETDTGGTPTPYAEPLFFKFNNTHSAFSLEGPVQGFFSPLGEKVVGTQSRIHPDLL
tara:strand:- start:10051 stop:11853 length:1803 start_codon:yes stop_codon:yes gene_type:complete